LQNRKKIWVLEDHQVAAMAKSIRARFPDETILQRFHIDLSSPNKDVAALFAELIEAASIVMYMFDDFWLNTQHPSASVPNGIDLLSPKNITLTEAEIKTTLRRQGLDPWHDPIRRPWVTQIARWDRWKNHSGAIETLRYLRRSLFVMALLQWLQEQA